MWRLSDTKVRSVSTLSLFLVPNNSEIITSQSLVRPLTRSEYAPPLWHRGEGHIHRWERGWESPNSDEGTYTVVLYMYFLTPTKIVAVWASIAGFWILAKMTVKSDKNLPNRSQFRLCTWKPCQLSCTDFDFELKIKIVRQFSDKGGGEGKRATSTGHSQFFRILAFYVV